MRVISIGVIRRSRCSLRMTATALRRFSMVAFFATVTQVAAAQTADNARAGPPYSVIFYKHEGLRLQAYLYKPAGAGPFPLVIYNHGSRDGNERAERPFPFIGRMLTGAGYAVLVPERRGYGKSDGATFRDDVGRDLGKRFITRMNAEAGDVLAALDSLKSDTTLVTARPAIMGWSFGGIVSVLAAGRADRFFAVVDQAGGALTWDRSDALQSALTDAARKIRVPTLCLDDENDATTAAATRVCEAVQTQKGTAELVIYPPFAPSQNPTNIAPGHLIFGAEGVSIWAADVIRFLDKYRAP